MHPEDELALALEYHHAEALTHLSRLREIDPPTAVDTLASALRLYPDTDVAAALRQWSDDPADATRLPFHTRPGHGIEPDLPF